MDVEHFNRSGVAGEVAHLVLSPPGGTAAAEPMSISLYDQGLIQVLQAAVTGLQPKSFYVLALTDMADGTVRVNSDAMNPMLMKALVALVPVSLLLVYSVAVLVTRNTVSA